MSLAQYTTSGCPEQFPDGTLGQVIIQGPSGPVWAGPSNILITDAGGYFATDNIEAALQQLAAGQTCEVIQDCIGGATGVTSGLFYDDASGTLSVILSPFGGLSHSPFGITINGGVLSASSCTPPVQVVGLDSAGNTLRFNMEDEVAPVPTYSEFNLPDYYMAGGAVPASQIGVVGGTLIVTNDSCKPRLARFSWQGWGFFNFTYPQNGIYNVKVSLNGGAFATDHLVSYKADAAAPPTTEVFNFAGKSYLERSFILAPGQTVQLDVRVDFTSGGVAAPGAYTDTGYSNVLFSKTLI